jgi:hypothetical protein
MYNFISISGIKRESTSFDEILFSAELPPDIEISNDAGNIEIFYLG